MKTVVVTTTAQVMEMKANMKECAALDVETTTDDKKNLGDFTNPSFKIVTVQVTFDGETAYVIPINHAEYERQLQEGVWQMCYAALGPYVKYWIMQNGKFDYKALKTAYNLDWFPSYDTMGAEYIIDENLKKDLETLAIKYLGVEPWKYLLKEYKDPYITPFNQLVEYGALDVIYTYQIWEQQRQIIGGNLGLARHISNTMFYDVLMPAYKALADMEITGMPIDMDKFDERLEETEFIIDQKENDLFNMVGEFNPRSVQQLGKVLYKDLGLPILEATKTGNPSTAESVLLRLRDIDESGVVNNILEYRKWAGYRSRYFNNWAQRLDKNYRLHPSYKPFHTVTGRLSCADPNLQQVPRDTFIRGLIGGIEGYKVVEVDYSQVELRLVAHYSRDEALVKAYNEGQDIHTLTAQAMTGKVEPEAEERKKAKAVNFGFVYGMGAEKFQMYARDNFGLKITLDEAQDTRRKFFQTYPTLVDWHEQQRQMVRRKGWVMNPLGRVRHLPDIDSSNEYFRAQAERQAINSPVQSLASDFMLMSLKELDKKYKDNKGVELIGTVHDSILFLIKNDEDLLTRLNEIKQVMENPDLSYYQPFKLSVPLTVDFKVGQWWSEGAEDLVLE